jgi:hypothetical protein
MENMEEIKSNSEKIWKIQKKIVKRYEKHGKYGRKVICFTKQLIFIPTDTELFPLTVGHNVNLNKLQAVLIVL